MSKKCEGSKELRFCSEICLLLLPFSRGTATQCPFGSVLHQSFGDLFSVSARRRGSILNNSKPPLFSSPKNRFPFFRILPEQATRGLLGSSVHIRGTATTPKPILPCMDSTIWGIHRSHRKPIQVCIFPHHVPELRADITHHLFEYGETGYNLLC